MAEYVKVLPIGNPIAPATRIAEAIDASLRSAFPMLVAARMPEAKVRNERNTSTGTEVSGHAWD